MSKGHDHSFCGFGSCHPCWIDTTCSIIFHLLRHFSGVPFPSTATHEPLHHKARMEQPGKAEIWKQILPPHAAIVCIRASRGWGHPDQQVDCGNRHNTSLVSTHITSLNAVNSPESEWVEGEKGRE